MRSAGDRDEALQGALRRAYRERERVEIGEEWRSGLMERIRRSGVPEARQDFFLVFEHFLWRLTPAICLLIILLGVVLFKVGFFSDQEVFRQFLGDPMEKTMAQLFGLKV